jgi:hypothetical protein
LNQVILWSLLVIPWLSLIFLDSSTIRRYMPVALFVTVINTLIYQPHTTTIGGENPGFLVGIMLPMFLGYIVHI